MADRWPSSVRLNPADPECTIIVRSTTGVTCRAHADRSSEAITFEAGGPAALGNGHPAEDAATHWGRCPTCERLFLRVPNLSSYAKVSHRVDVRYFDPGVDLEPAFEDNHLDESSPGTNRAGQVLLRCGTIAGYKRIPTIEFQPLAPLLPPRSRVIKAEYWIKLSTFTSAVAFTLHRVLRDAPIGESCWNEFRAGSAWTVAGCRGAGTDYDTPSMGSATPIATGWFPLMAGSAFSAEVEARKAEVWRVVAVEADFSGSFAAASMNAAADLPYLRLWYERPAVDVGEE